MSDEANLLGGYLRARRELVTPDQAGIPVLGLRRVPGLRREEVAMLAGISADYYLRLEQGRDHHPSVPVLESLARVLHLAANALATALSPRLVPGANRLRDVLLDPAEQELYPDWPDDTERAPMHVDHAQAGDLRLNREKL